MDNEAWSGLETDLRESETEAEWVEQDELGELWITDLDALDKHEHERTL